MSHRVFSLYKHLVIARESEHGQALSSALGSSKGVDFFLLLMLTKVGLAGMVTLFPGAAFLILQINED